MYGLYITTKRCILLLTLKAPPGYKKTPLFFARLYRRLLLKSNEMTWKNKEVIIKKRSSHFSWNDPLQVPK